MFGYYKYYVRKRSSQGDAPDRLPIGQVTRLHNKCIALVIV